MQSKDRVLDALTSYQNYVTNHFHAKIKILRTDNGGEYTGNAFKHHLDKHGITHQTSCSYTPQQNGVAERKNRHLMEVARSMMFHTNVPKCFWGDAVLSACYLINRIPTKILNDVSPYQVLNQTPPLVNHLRVFGCLCFVLVPGEQRNKLEPKSMKAMFIGYSSTQKGYKCYVPNTRRVMVSRDVKFMEHKGYYKEQSWNELADLSSPSSDRAANLRSILEGLGIHQSKEGTTRPQAPRTNSTRPQASTSDVESSHLDPEGGTNNEDQEAEWNENQEAETQSETVEPEAETQLETVQPAHNGEESFASAHDQGGMTTYEEGDSSNQSPQVLRRSTRIRKDPSNWVNTRVYYNAQAVAHPSQAVCSFAVFPTDHQAS